MIIVPGYEFRARIEFPLGRQLDRTTMQGVVISAVFIIFSNPAAHLEVVIGGYGNVSSIEQAMYVGAKEYSIRDLMGTALAKRLYMTGFKGRQGAFLGYGASSLVGICNQYTEASLA